MVYYQPTITGLVLPDSNTRQTSRSSGSGSTPIAGARESFMSGLEALLGQGRETWKTQGNRLGAFARGKGMALLPAAAGIGALMAASDFASRQDPSLTGLQAAAGPAGAFAGGLAGTAGGAALGGLAGGPIGALIGGVLGGMAGPEIGGQLGQGLAGATRESPEAKQLRLWKNAQQAAVDAEAEEIRTLAPLQQEIEQQALAQRIAALQAEQAIRAQDALQQSLNQQISMVPNAGAMAFQGLF